MQAAAIRHLVGGAVLRGFAKWAVGVAALAAARALLDSPLAHWVNVSLARAYRSWAAVARGKAMQAAAIRHLVGGAVLRGFSKWAAGVAALAALRLAIATPLTSWINASLARALRSWAAVARGKAMQAAALRQMMFGAFLRGFSKWAAGVAALAALSRAIATPLTSWANASLARAYRSWAASARGKAMQASAIRHLVGGAVLRGFTAWAGVDSFAAATKALVAESVGRWASAGSFKALRTWAGIALLRVRTTSLLRQAVSVWRARLLGLGLHRWLASSSQVLASARGLRGPVPHLFALWRDATRRSQALLGLAAGVAMRWELGGVLAAYAAWREVARGRRLQLTALAYLAHGAFLRGFDKWAAVVLSKRLASPLAQWAGASLARAYRTWVVVARGKSMQVAALRQMMFGAFLRGFSKWAAGMAALTALRRAVATPLTSWANHSLAAAWRGWASASTERALIRRCAQGFAHGETARRLHLWRDQRCAQHAVKRALAPALGRWQMRTTTAAFDGWAASARGKAMQAAALHSLVDGAVLRGFANWAAGVAALAALRRAIATPLTSWANASLARALRSWTAVAHGKTVQAAAIRHLVGGALLRGFAKWAAGVAAFAALSRAIATPLTSWANASLARAYRSWTAVARSKAMQSAAIRHLVGGALLRGFAAWVVAHGRAAAAKALAVESVGRWASAGSREALHTWAGIALLRARTTSLLRQAVSAWRARLLGLGLRCWLASSLQLLANARGLRGPAPHLFALWRDATWRSHALLGLAAGAATRWELGETFRGFARWRQAMGDAALQLTALAHLMHGAFLRGFTAWAVAQSRKAAGRALVSQAVGRWATLGVRRALDRLADAARAVRMARAAAVRSLLVGWRALHAHALAARALRGVSVAFVLRAALRGSFARMRAGVLTAVTAAVFSNAATVKRALRHALRRWAHVSRLTRSAASIDAAMQAVQCRFSWLHWQAVAHERLLAARAVGHWQTASVGTACNTWAGAHSRAAATKALAAQSLGSWASAGSFKALRTWAGIALLRARTTSLLRQAISVWRARLLGLGLRRWLASSSQVLASARGLRGPVPHLFALWRDATRRSQALFGLAAGVATRWELGGMLAAYAAWREVARGRRLQLTALAYLAHGAFLRGFDKWAAVVLSKRLASPLAQWAGASLARAYRTWVVVARGKSMQVAALRQMMFGAFLRGFSKWAAGMAALTALRRAVATPLTSWANHSLAAAWRGWASASTERALIRRCAQGFAHGETARRLHLWRDQRCAQHAVKRALAPALGRWQMRTTTAAFDGWAASARGKAMQAAALHSLVDGAVLRGFANWAAGVAALAALRRAIATPLTSWANASLARALRSWTAVAHGKTVQAAAIRHLVGGALLRGFTAWAGVHSFAAATKALVAESVGRWASAGSFKALRTLAGIALLRARTTSLLRQAISVWRARLLGLGLRRWLASSSQVLASARGLRGPVPHLFALWRDATRRSQALFGLAAGGATRWELGGALAAYAAWREVARGRRLQLTALVHLAQGAFLRGFDKWAVAHSRAAAGRALVSQAVDRWRQCELRGPHEALVALSLARAQLLGAAAMWARLGEAQGWRAWRALVEARLMLAPSLAEEAREQALRGAMRQLQKNAWEAAAVSAAQTEALTRALSTWASEARAARAQAFLLHQAVSVWRARLLGLGLRRWLASSSQVLASARGLRGPVPHLFALWRDATLRSQALLGLAAGAATRWELG
ncbi:hypothetical protein T492DRAFT_895293, partial [Pavlovales sp. CCMP2436]